MPITRRSFVAMLASVPSLGRLAPVPHGTIPMHYAGTVRVAAAPFEVWVAEPGTSFPSRFEAPGEGWAKLPQYDAGLTTMSGSVRTNGTTR